VRDGRKQKQSKQKETTWFEDEAKRLEEGIWILSITFFSFPLLTLYLSKIHSLYSLKTKYTIERERERGSE